MGRGTKERNGGRKQIGRDKKCGILVDLVDDRLKEKYVSGFKDG